MDKPIVTGILAFGLSGRVFHAPFIHAHPGFELYAISERSKKEAASLYPTIKSFNSAEEVISDPNIELVIINTPNYTHYEFAKAALLVGKHVLVDKPFAATSSEARELFDLAKKVGKKIMVYQNRRWDGDYLSVKKVIESGKLGKLIEVNLRFDRYKKVIGPKTFKETPMPASGISYDLGSHILDQAISLFGEPIKSIKLTGAHRENSQVDDYATFHLVYPNHLNVIVTVSLLTAEPVPSYVIHGTNGSFHKYLTNIQEEQLGKGISPLAEEYGIEAEDKKGVLTIVGDSGAKTKTLVENEKGNYMGLFDAVYNCIRLDQAFPVTEEEIMCQLKLLEQPAL